VIVDRYNEIPAGARIGFEPQGDAARYHRTESGIVVIPKGDHTMCGTTGEPTRFL
jgi:glucose-1-phosphate adenylyltransferase